MASSEIKPRSTITEAFRVENAKKFIQAFRSRPYPNDFGSDSAQYERQWASVLDNQEDVFYMSIGRIVPWVYSEGIDSDIPEPNSTWRDLTSIWSNMLSIKRVQSTDVVHVIPRENWNSDNESYPYYRSEQSNTTTYDDAESENFYVLDENEFRVYKCLWNNYGVRSADRPITIGGADEALKTQSEPFTTSDGYIWKYMYTIEPSETLRFVTNNYIPVRADRVNDDNSSTDGAIYKIALTGKYVNDVEDDPRDTAFETPSGEKFARVRVEELHSDSNDVSLEGDLVQINIDLTNEDNSGRFGASETDDLVGYQVEHVVDRESEIRVEIGRIVSSTVDFVDGERQSVILQVERLDSQDEKMFTVVDPEEERWFISPYVQIYGEGREATAMVLLENESKGSEYDLDFREFYPENPVRIDGIVDIHMNTYGHGYRNIYYRDVDGEDHSLVVIRKGRADIGEGLDEESALVPEQDRKMRDFAHIVSITPLGGHSYDNVAELYGWNVMINQTFQSSEDSFANIVNDFRQVALIQNPITQDNTVASDEIFRQSIRLEFDGDLTVGDSALQLDDEISDTDDRNKMRRVFGYVSDWEVVEDDNGDPKTQVYLSSSFGFLERSAEEIYELNDDNEMFITYRGETGDQLSGEESIVLNLSDRIKDELSDGALQKGLGSIDESLQMFSGQVMYIENRLPISRSDDQSENIKLVIEY